MTRKIWQGATILVAGLGLLGAVLLWFELLSPEVAYEFSSIIYPLVSVGAGALVMTAAGKVDGTERLAWRLVGLGIVFWGLGETIWVWYSFIAHVEVPYPGWADVLYLAGYPIMFIGVLFMPHLRLLRYERIRLTLDTVAGSVAIAAVMWTAYLADVVYLDPEAGLAERFVNILYPLVDVVLLIALLILAVRRTTRRFDPRLLALATGILVTAFADITYVFQLEEGTYVDGGPLDALWLVGYALFAVAGYYVTKPPVEREEQAPGQKLWQVVAPYTAVAALFALTAIELGRGGGFLQWASFSVSLIVIARQGFAIKETREVVAKQRDNLVASVSHELRTPLTSIRGFSQLLNSRWDSLDDERRREMIATIDDQSRYLTRLVTDLVDVARNEVIAVELDVEPISAAALIEDVVLTTADDDRATGPIGVGMPSDFQVVGDRSRLKQILVNLVTNAVRYGNGDIAIEAMTDHGQAVIEIHDNGPGVAKKHEEAIWERFERGAHRLDSSVPGSGIGLAIARGLAIAHDGSLTYRRSTLLGGACFRLTLPLSDAPEPAEELEPALSLPSS